jgi:hypothetical protein
MFATIASIGIAAAFGAGCAGSDEQRSTPAPSPLDSIVPSSPSDIPQFEPSTDPHDVARAEPATDPAGAVRGYLSAEIAGDAERSYGALAAASRESVGSVGDWIETASERPTIVAFELDGPVAAPPAGSAEVSVSGTVTFEPRLDEVSGFVPERAAVEWDVVAEDGGWRVDVIDSSVSPILPDEQGATAAAATWAAARQQCRTDAEYAGSLLGSPVLGDRLCGVAGELVAGSPAPLDDALATQVVAAFGSDATTWARSVVLSGAAQLSVVTAPFGDHWVVVGVGG